MKTILLILMLMPCWCAAQYYKEIKTPKGRIVVNNNGDTLKSYGTNKVYFLDKEPVLHFDTVKAHITVRPFSEYIQIRSNSGWIEYGYRVKTSDGFVYFLDTFKFIIDPERIVKAEIKDWDKPGRRYYY